MTQDLRDDTTTSSSMSAWYYAPFHWQEICQYVDAWQGCQDLHALDIFGASQAIRQAWRRRLYRAEAWDIKIDPGMDLVQVAGFFWLLNLCLRLPRSWFHLMSMDFIWFHLVLQYAIARCFETCSGMFWALFSLSSDDYIEYCKIYVYI